LFDGVMYFVAVAEEGSFLGAARRLGVSAAAVSKAVSQLEGEVGVSLLYRTTRRVSVSEEGERFLERCQEAVRLVSSARVMAAGAGQQVAGELVISASPALSRLLMPVLGQLAARHPALKVHVRFEDELARFVEEPVHVALRMGALADSSLVAMRVAETRWALVASPAYLSELGAQIDGIEALKRARCIKYKGPSGQVSEWVFGGAAAGERAPTTATMDQGALLVDAAQAGWGVCQVLRFMVEGELERGELVEVLPSLSVAGPPIHALCLPGHQRHPRVRALWELFAMCR
jgi:DNA-binding transcriptional LysR family regulator